MKLSNSQSFPNRLNYILDDPSNSSIIAWQSNGQSFSILDMKQFEKYILPKYFRHSHFTSFVRQLNMYNFHKIRDLKTTEFCYHNVQFYKGNPQNNLIERKITSKKDLKRNSVSTHASTVNIEKCSGQINSESVLSVEIPQKEIVEMENTESVPELISRLTEEIRSKDYIIECDVQGEIEQLLKSDEYKSIDRKFLPFIFESLGIEYQKKLKRQISLKTEELLAIELDQPSMKLIL